MELNNEKQATIKYWSQQSKKFYETHWNRENELVEWIYLVSFDVMSVSPSGKHARIFSPCNREVEMLTHYYRFMQIWITGKIIQQLCPLPQNITDW